MPMLRGVVSIPGFGYLYAFVLLLLILPMVMMYGTAWGYYPHSVGFEIRTKPETLKPGLNEEEPLIVTLQPVSSNTTSVETGLCLNSSPISWTQLRDTLREELSRRANRVVYIAGDEELPVAEVVRVVDEAEGAWFGVPVVLLTPKLKEQTKYGHSCPVRRK